MSKSWIWEISFVIALFITAFFVVIIKAPYLLVILISVISWTILFSWIIGYFYNRKDKNEK
jgi:Flp pilus assembly protein TadB